LGLPHSDEEAGPTNSSRQSAALRGPAASSRRLRPASQGPFRTGPPGREGGEEGKGPGRGAGSQLLAGLVGLEDGAALHRAPRGLWYRGVRRKGGGL